jgi:hypothetical protein
MAHDQPTQGLFNHERSQSDLKPDSGNRYYVRDGPTLRGAKRGGARATPPDVPPEADIKQGLDISKVIETIAVPADPATPKGVSIENVKYVASYNWVDTEKPTIIVPGQGFTTPVFSGLHMMSESF